MDAIANFLVDYGLWGMFLSAFLAGSILPFSSEVVMFALAAAGVDTTVLLAVATTGNLLGGLFNYWVGTFGKEEWITRHMRIEPEKLQRGIAYARRYGAWTALFSWFPILGGVTNIALGLLRVNFWLTALFMFIGKFVRYLIIMATFNLVI